MLVESSMASYKMNRHSILYSVIDKVFVECFDGCLMLVTQHKFGMCMRVAIPYDLSQLSNLRVDCIFKF